MHPIIETIKAQGVPVHSAVRAGHYLGKSEAGIGTQTDATYIGWIKEITGVEIENEGSDLIRMIYCYLVIEAIEAIDRTDNLVANDLLEAAKSRAHWIVTTSPWLFAKPEDEHSVTGTGQKGSKQQIARKVYDEKIRDKNISRKDAIALLVEAGASTSPAGASTVYAKLKKGEL